MISLTDGGSEAWIHWIWTRWMHVHPGMFIRVKQGVITRWNQV